MQLAGVAIADREVLNLAGRIRDAGFNGTAELLEDGWDREVPILALTIDDREAIIRTLEGCPTEYAELRVVLLREVEWRRREGL
jgi:hypothetical protein